MEPEGKYSIELFKPGGEGAGLPISNPPPAWVSPHPAGYEKTLDQPPLLSAPLLWLRGASRVAPSTMRVRGIFTTGGRKTLAQGVDTLFDVAKHTRVFNDSE
jgi:hypothetical protein